MAARVSDPVHGSVLLLYLSLSVLASRQAPRSRPLELLASRRAGEEWMPGLPIQFIKETLTAAVRSDASQKGYLPLLCYNIDLS